MPIPNFQSIILPFLKLIGDREEHPRQQIVELLAKHFELTDEERREVTATGKTLFDNRCDWAKDYLRRIGLLEATGRGYYKITERGFSVYDTLSQNSSEIEDMILRPRTELVGYLDENFPVESDEDGSLPFLERSFREIYQKMQGGLAAELLVKINNNPPDFFENLVIDLLVKMGYGGSREDAETVGRSGDGGIDGIIKEDALGLDMIYIQAKRWLEGNVGRPELQKFVGALHERHAQKGIFITTSDFTPSAIGYVERIASNIILIDGGQLVQLMIDHDVGVSVEKTYEIKRVDSDYFAQDTENS